MGTGESSRVYSCLSPEGSERGDNKGTNNVAEVFLDPKIIVKVYLMRVRSLHYQENLRPDWSFSQVAPAIKGADNRPGGSLGVRNRIPVTPFLLKKIKSELVENSTLSLHQKRLLWLYCTWAYVGAFRSSDLLSEQAKSYRPGSTLLYNCVQWHSESVNGEVIRYLTVHVQEPKEKARANSSAVVELLPLKKFLCPVRAWEKFTRSRKGTRPGDAPIFSDGNSLLTAAKLNRWLRKLLSSHVDYEKEQVLGHSFRYESTNFAQPYLTILGRE